MSERAVGAASSGAASAIKDDGLERLREATRTPRPPRLPAWGRWLSAPAAVAASLLIQSAILPDPRIAPFAILSFAVALAAWLGGSGPGVLSVALSALAANWFFFSPHHAWALDGASLSATALFLLGAAPIALFCATLREALFEAERTAGTLRQQADLLRLSHDAIFVWRFGGSIESWNHGAEELYGYRADEACGRESHELLRTVFPEPLAEVEARLRREGRWEGALRHTTKDGRVITVASRLQLVRGDDGVARVLEITRDVTERVRDEETIRRLNEALLDQNAALDAERLRWRGVIEAVIDEVWVADAEGRVSLLNLPAVTGMDFAPTKDEPIEEILGRLDLFHPDGRPRAVEETPLVRSLRGETVRGEEILRDPSTGATRYRQYSCAPMRDPRGAIIGAVAISRDITENKRTEAALRDSEERFRTLADNIAQLAWMGDASGSIVWYNQRWYDYTGTTLDEMRGWGWQKVHHPDFVDRVVAKLVRCFATGEVWEDTFPLRGKDGAYRWFLSRAIPIHDEAGKVVRWFGTNTDVTEQREAERRKDEFLAVLSHELRNPLAPIRNGLHVLGRVPPGSEAAEKARAVIERQITHMARLIGDLLDVSRISRGKIQIRHERVDLAAVVGRAVEDHRPVFAARGISLCHHAPERPVWATGDADRLAQIVGNVLLNAAKFTPEHGEVDLSLRVEGQRAVVRVRDSGVGIPKDMLARIFEPFTQAKQALDRSAGGLGLGLSLVKELVALHGGDIEAQSEGSDRGAEFKIRLPLASGAPEEAAPSGGGDAPSGRRVLIIEDNVDAAESLKEALALDAHEVNVAFDGLDGLDQARAFTPDVVLCDIGLPGMDGYAVARAFRADAALRDVTLVALTGYALAQDQQRAAEAGFDRHLAKPPDLDELERILMELPARKVA